MALKPFSKSHTQVPDLGRIQEDLEKAINPIIHKEIVDGVLTDVVALTTAFQNVPHKLGERFVGWIVLQPDADARVWQDLPSNNPNSSKFIRVRASAAVNCKFWVF